MAVVAALSGLTGVLITAKYHERAEHKKWLRDLRVQIYGSLSSAAEDFSRALAEVPAPTQQELVSRVVHIVGLQNQVTTFGAQDVAIAGVKLLHAFQQIALANPPSSDQMKAARNSFSEYLIQVRRTLEIGPD